MSYSESVIGMRCTCSCLTAKRLCTLSWTEYLKTNLIKYNDYDKLSY